MKRPVWKRVFIVAAVLLVVVVALLFLLGPESIDRAANRRLNPPPYRVTPEAQNLYDDLFVVDLHGDPLLWGRDLNERHDYGAIDVPRLIEGNVAIQAFFIVSKTPFGMNINRTEGDSDMITLLAVFQGWPAKTWGSLFERALFTAERLRQTAERSNGRLLVITNKAEFQRYRQARSENREVTAGILGVEGAQVLEGELDNLAKLFDAGVRIMAPTHFFDTQLGGSAHGVEKGGLTELGRQVIADMEARSILLDLAHASSHVIDDALQIATRPVIVSHTGVKGTCDNNRNLSDAQVRAIAKTGGVIGIGYWPTAVCGDDAAAIARAIRYTIDLVGPDYVALGSDFDGAVPVPFDTTGLALIVQELMDQGLDETVIRQVMGENAARVFQETLPE